MRKIIGAILLATVLSPIALFALETSSLEQFVRGNIIPQNAAHFGLSSIAELENVSFGKPIPMEIISNKTLTDENVNEFSSVSGEEYVPVIVNGMAKFFVVVDKNGLPVSMGYKTLADEFSKIASRYSLGISDIKIYKSLDINAFLFSVPTLRAANLTVLKPEWDKKRAALSSKDQTLELLLNASKGVK